MFSFKLKRFVYNFLIHVYLMLTLLCFCSSQPLCYDHEKTSLLQFKERFTIEKSASSDPRACSKVDSWTQQGGTHDCCSWDGVECDEDTGHVISLDLSSSCLYGSLDSNSSLFRLVHLRRLNLADNHFNYSQIPTAIKRFSMLTYLNLSTSFFSGQIPSEVSELFKLSSLDLSRNIDRFSQEKLLELKSPDFKSLILNLTSLEQLHLSKVDISSTVPYSLVNFSSLTSLRLVDCGLKGEFPTGIFQLPNLQTLSIGYNADLTGNLPPFNQTSSLNTLDALECKFSGEIPTSVGKLSHLTFLELSGNNFSGQIPSSIANLTQLIYLALSRNHFNGLIPFSFSKLLNLEVLFLYGNDLSGTVDFDMFISLRNLSLLFLGNNKLSVLIKPNINKTFPQFTVLGLGNCNLGHFPDFLSQQKRLEFLQIHDSNIGGKIPEWMFNSSRETLRFLSLPENSLMGEVSPSICNLSSLAVLQLSNNYLTGNLPQCFGYFSKSLSILDLTHNLFSGNIPTFTEAKQLKVIFLNDNQLEGKLPRSLMNCSALKYLDLGNNNLSDVFPYWLGTLPKLEILVLRSNGFHGVIQEPRPNNFEFPSLRMIDISYNNFIGKLPCNYIQSWKAMKNSSVGDSNHVEQKPVQYISEFIIIRHFSFRFFSHTIITIKGMDRVYRRIPSTIVIINLSNNKFDGEIPKIIGNLKGLISLDLSNNNLIGNIPSSLGNLLELESLDLSQNELTAEIPQELAQLTFLQYFNVSHNHLTGPIPLANQLTTFESSSYEDNLGLCGIPLANKCGNSQALDQPLYEEEQEESSSFFEFGWKVVVIGYGCGFVVGLFIGQIVIARKPNWYAMTVGVRKIRVRRNRRARPRN